MIKETIRLMCFCAIILLIFFVIIFLINYAVYVSQNLLEANDKCYEYDFASIKDYECILYDLNINPYCFYSKQKYTVSKPLIILEYTVSKSLIILDGRMMILYPISYFKFVHRFDKRKRKRIKGLWKSYLK